MRLWPFGRKKTPARPEVTVVPFPPELEDLPVLKYHGLRALCGWFMDRHSECVSPHPWCRQPPGEGIMQLIAHVIPQVWEDGDGLLLAIYFTRAKGSELDQNSSEEVDPLQYTVDMTYAEASPSRKLVVHMASDGTYVGNYGPILNPVEGDYSTGRLDQEADVRTFYCDPEPAGIKYQYWDTKLSAEQNVVPEFHCLRLRGEWWVVDFDRERGLAQQVAAISVMDNPKHNFGIHSEQNKNATYLTTDDGSEFSKVVRENLVRTLPP